MTAPAAYPAESTAAVYGYTVGDGVYADTLSDDDADYGEILSIDADGEHAEIGWQSGTRTRVDLSDRNLKVYVTPALAEAAYVNTGRRSRVRGRE